MGRRPKPKDSVDKTLEIAYHPRAGRAYDKKLLKQTPFSVIRGAPRLLLLHSPCCGRRFRVEVTVGECEIQFESFRMCHHCRALWRLQVEIDAKRGTFQVQFRPI